eukprot:405827-Pyramimonas_sp.AAC.1
MSRIVTRNSLHSVSATKSFVQETHGTIADANCIRQEFRHANVGFPMFQDSTRAGGLATFIAADLAQQFFIPFNIM